MAACDHFGLCIPFMEVAPSSSDPSLAPVPSCCAKVKHVVGVALSSLVLSVIYIVFVFAVRWRWKYRCSNSALLSVLVPRLSLPVCLFDVLLES